MKFHFVSTVLPRIIFDKFLPDDYSKMLSNQNEQRAVADLIVNSCKLYSFDGIVLEMWTPLAAAVSDQYISRLVKQIGMWLLCRRHFAIGIHDIFLCSRCYERERFGYRAGCASRSSG